MDGFIWNHVLTWRVGVGIVAEDYGATMEGEILAPLPAKADHDARGRFAPGNKAAETRGPNITSRQARDMILEALNMVGGAQYLAMVAITQPAAFCTLVGRVIPLKIEGDPNAPVFTIIERRVVTNPK